MIHTYTHTHTYTNKVGSNHVTFLNLYIDIMCFMFSSLTKGKEEERDAPAKIV